MAVYDAYEVGVLDGCAKLAVYDNETETFQDYVFLPLQDLHEAGAFETFVKDTLGLLNRDTVRLRQP